MLEIKNVFKTFNEGTINEKKVFADLSLTLKEGDFVTIIGGNGAGKSTMLNVVAGAYPVDDGQVIIDGVDVTKLPEYKRAAYIGRVFQDPRMGTASDMWVEENMSVADSRGLRRGLRWAITAKDRERYKELLTQLDLGLENRLSTKMGLLSGGQRQAITLLMAAMISATWASFLVSKTIDTTQELTSEEMSSRLWSISLMLAPVAATICSRLVS